MRISFDILAWIFLVQAELRVIQSRKWRCKFEDLWKIGNSGVVCEFLYHPPCAQRIRTLLSSSDHLGYLTNRLELRADLLYVHGYEVFQSGGACEEIHSRGKKY